MHVIESNYNQYHRDIKIHEQILKPVICQQLDNWEEIDTFLETCNLHRLNQEKIGNMNRPISVTEIELGGKNQQQL